MSAMDNTAGLKGLHDRLLAEKPADAAHDAAVCPLCAIDATDDPTGGSVTYTEEDLQAAVEKAVSPLKARINELEQSQQISEVESAKAAVREEMQAQLDDLQTQLDAAVLKAQAAEQEKDGIVAWLEAERDAAEQAQVLAARREERLARVREAANFPEDYLEKNAERFVAMSDEDFEIAVEGWKAIAGSNTGGSTLPEKTGLHASHESTTRQGGSALKEIIGLRRSGPVDLTTL